MPEKDKLILEAGGNPETAAELREMVRERVKRKLDLVPNLLDRVEKFIAEGDLLKARVDYYLLRGICADPQVKEFVLNSEDPKYTEWITRYAKIKDILGEDCDLDKCEA